MSDHDGAATAASPGGLLTWLNRQLRITAIRDMFSMVEIRRAETLTLVALAVTYALTEGVGLSVLLPVLRFAEAGTATISGGGLLMEWPGRLAEALHVPLNLMTLLILAFIPVMLRQVTFYLNAWYSAVVSNRITVRLRVDTYAKMMDADADFFTSRPQGEFTGALLGQTTLAGQTVLAVMRLLSVALQIVIYVALLAFLSLRLTLLAALAGLIVSQLLRKHMSRTQSFGMQVAQVTQDVFAAIVERVALARLVKMRSEEQTETSTVAELSERTSTASVAIAKLAAAVEVTADPLLMFFAFVILYLGIAVMGLRLAELGMLLYVLTRLNGKIKEFNGVRQQISAGVASIFTIRRVAADALAANTIKGGSRPFGVLGKSIVLERVSFRYPNAEGPTLHDLNAEIQAGSFTAIVGRSGAGKSTFVELLPRLRDVSSGAVRYDGIDVREFELSSLRRSIGYLTQDPMLFNNTLRMNLLYGAWRDVGDAEIDRVLEQAHATFVKNLPLGLETRLGDRGVRFSGGERQRIALARVLLHRPALLILDEPTSALDSESEQHIQQALAELHGTTTIVVIAHRLATVVAADQLLVMENGRIVQRGVHGALADAEGPYRHLFESQLYGKAPRPSHAIRDGQRDSQP